ncbi:hypothetical protein NDU88_009334 [Pleurodeles waltl]|uniref:Receptor ligand binding region domain-containing protein n=1 Tax=Pleurodeles waltl TaxID=8319 RepID=A0AAV7PUH3_PLEWA|nr:hypothetical protein NDU88_009334 [Pleurodeles waltl]
MDRYHRLLAMVYAVQEVNQNPHLLPNITLGFNIYDSCYNEDDALRATLQILSGQEDASPNYRCDMGSRTAGIIGDMLNTASIMMARLLGIYRYPQVSAEILFPTVR